MKTEYLNNTTEQMDLTNIHREFHSPAPEYTFFSSVHKIVSRIDRNLGHKTIFNKFMKMEIITHIFPTPKV